MSVTPERIVRHPREFNMTPDMVHPDEGHVHYIRADVAEPWKRERDHFKYLVEKALTGHAGTPAWNECARAAIAAAEDPA